MPKKHAFLELAEPVAEISTINLVTTVNQVENCSNSENGEKESSAATQKNHVLKEVDDEPFEKISTINPTTLHQEENCAATIPLTMHELSSTVPSVYVNERKIQEGGEDDDGASVKSDSSRSSAGSVWVMEDMVKSTASIPGPVSPKDDPRHHHGSIF